MQSNAYDEELLQIDVFQRYPELLPFIGGEFGREYPRVLFVAESHYLPPESTAHLDPKVWYASRSNKLCPRERSWINTRNIVSRGYGHRWKSKGHTIYQNMDRALVEAGVKKSDNSFQFFAFMNAFQRPAVTGDSLKVCSLDVESAVSTIKNVLNIIDPQHLCFVSRKAYRLVAPTLPISSDGTPHPASPWWNRRSKRGSGKSQFINHVGSYIT